MARRLLLCLLAFGLLASPAAGDNIGKKHAIDSKIQRLHEKAARAREREGQLKKEIGQVSAQIRVLQKNVLVAQARLNTLDMVLAHHEQQLDRLNELFRLQTKKLNLLRRSYYEALARLERRVIDAYETPDVNAVDVMLSSTSMSAMLRDIEYVQQIGAQDKRISDQLNRARHAMHRVREQTRTTKHKKAQETAVVRQHVVAQKIATRNLLSNAQQLAAARASKRDTLVDVSASEQQFIKEASILEQQSAALESRIRASESSAPAPTGTGSVSASGLIWPVSGPITSPFGPRCLSNGDCRFHPGVDIGVPSGTSIRAAASGTVIYAGWMDGYGNMVVIDHGNHLSTGYAHQSSIAVGNGASVSQGEVIGYSGCTGYCFGPHLHFEVRVNGAAVDPLHYL